MNQIGTTFGFFQNFTKQMLRNKFADLHFNQIAISVLFHRIRTRKKSHFPPLEPDRKSFCIHSKFYKTHVKKQVCWPPLQSDSQQRIVLQNNERKKIKSYFHPLESDRKNFLHSFKILQNSVKQTVCWPPLQSDSQQRIVSPHKNEKKSKKNISFHLNQIGTTFGFIQNFTKQMLRNNFANLHFNQIASSVLFHRIRTRKKGHFPPLELDRNSFCIHSNFYKTDVRKQVRWPPLQSDSQQRIVQPHKKEKK